ncbi:MAG: ParA family protein [Zoogloea sp.]|nr:ParA family protein [Zoogloea sp.]
MSRIICIIGNKGGTGKTTLSHMLCQGLGLLGQRSVCVLTDTAREPLVPDSRRYVIADARTPETLTRVVDKLRSLPEWIGVIDGGGNRSEVDRRLNGVSDIVVLPFRDSHEDMRTVIRDLETFSRAYAIPSQWPTNAWARDAADRSVTQLMSAHRNRILRPVHALASSKLLLQKQIPDALPTPLANACRALARQLLDVLEVAYTESADESAEAGEDATATA